MTSKAQGETALLATNSGNQTQSIGAEFFVLAAKPDLIGKFATIATDSLMPDRKSTRLNSSH